MFRSYYVVRLWFHSRLLAHLTWEVQRLYKNWAYFFATGWVHLRSDIPLRPLSCIIRITYSAVGVNVYCRVHPMPGSWFGFPVNTNQAFHAYGVGESVPDCLERIKRWIVHRLPTESHCMARHASKSPPSHTIGVECVAHSKRDWATPSFILYTIMFKKHYIKNAVGEASGTVPGGKTSTPVPPKAVPSKNNRAAALHIRPVLLALNFIVFSSIATRPFACVLLSPFCSTHSTCLILSFSNSLNSVLFLLYPSPPQHPFNIGDCFVEDSQIKCRDPLLTRTFRLGIHRN